MNKKFVIIICIFTISNLIYTTSKAEKMYFCMAADSDFKEWLLNLIGSIHKVNFKETEEIAVYDLGLKTEDRRLLNSIEKVRVYDIEMTHPDLLKHFVIRKSGKKARGWYAWKPVVIKQALERFPYVLYLDAGCVILNPLNGLFQYINDNGYFISNRSIDNTYDRKKDINKFLLVDRCTTYMINKFLKKEEQRKKVLNSPIIISSAMGFSRIAYNSFVLPMYNLTKDLRNFQDDGTCPKGFGHCLHDLSVYAIFAYKKKLNLIPSNKKLVLQSTNSKFQFSISKFGQNNPNIYWHCKGQLAFKKYINFKKATK